MQIAHSSVHLKNLAPPQSPPLALHLSRHPPPWVRTRQKRVWSGYKTTVPEGYLEYWVHFYVIKIEEGGGVGGTEIRFLYVRVRKLAAAGLLGSASPLLLPDRRLPLLMDECIVDELMDVTTTTSPHPCLMYSTEFDIYIHIFLFKKEYARWFLCGGFVFIFVGQTFTCCVIVGMCVMHMNMY